jgi:tetratricopeptide (TPR) repeat protein
MRANLVFPQGSEFRFAHALIWEGVYGALLKRRRQEMHRRAAQWYATRDAALHAEHLERALDKSAPAAYLAAARQQADQYRHDAALGLLRRGLALDPEPTQRHALHLLDAEVQRELGHGRLSAKAARLAFKAASDDLEKARGLIGVAEALRVLDRLDGALARLDRAERLLGKADHPLERSRIHHLRGNLYFPMGKVAECLREHEAALMQAKFAASIEGEVRALGGIADALYMQGRFRSSYEHFERCVAQAEAHGFGRIAVANRPMLCATASLIGRLEDNRRHGARAIADAARVGNKRAELVARTALGIGELDAHAFDSLREQIAACYRLLETTVAPRFLQEVQAIEALCLLLSEGRSERALDLIRQALKGARQTSMTYLGPWILGLLAYATADDGERTAACQEAEALIAEGVPFHNIGLYFSIILELHIERRAWDQVEHYARLLEDQLGPEPAPRSVHEIAVGKALVALNRGGSAGIRDEFVRLKAEQEKTGKMFCRAAIEAALAVLEPAARGA